MPLQDVNWVVFTHIENVKAHQLNKQSNGKDHICKKNNNYLVCIKSNLIGLSQITEILLP